MKIQELRKVIKENNFNVKVMARTNGCIKATAFDVDDLNDLNKIIKERGYIFETFMPGTRFESYPLIKAGA